MRAHGGMGKQMRAIRTGQISVFLTAALSWGALSHAQSRTLNAARGKPARVWSVDKPLFEELMGERPMGRSARGALLWRHDEGHIEFGLQYGVVRTRENDLKKWRLYGG